MKEVAGAVGGALQNDLGAFRVGHGLQHAGRVRLGMRPERHFRAVEQLDGGRASHAFRARRAEHVTRVRLGEDHPVRIGDPRGAPDVVLAPHLEALHDVEQVLRRRLLVREDIDTHALCVHRAVKEARRYVCAAALLAAFQNQRSHAARLPALRFERRVDVLLGAVEHEPGQRAGLAADADVGLRKMREIGRELLARAFLDRKHVGPRLWARKNPGRRRRPGLSGSTLKSASQAGPACAQKSPSTISPLTLFARIWEELIALGKLFFVFACISPVNFPQLFLAQRTRLC